MGTYVYIDGFNFYNRVYKYRTGTRLPAYCKWLDLLKFARVLRPGESIDWIGYFTAPAKSDPGTLKRQEAYLRALSTLPEVEIIMGKFERVTKTGMPTLKSCTCATVRRFRTNEEKGSDVNIAARMVRDACLNRFSASVLITNDSDLLEPIRIITQELGKPVHVISPDRSQSTDLRKYATSSTVLDINLIPGCLFPTTLTDSTGKSIVKPNTWV